MSPELVVLNDRLAKDLNLDFSKVEKKDLSQNIFWKHIAKRIFKHYSSSICRSSIWIFYHAWEMVELYLLGEHLVNNTNRFDVQFKGSGRTSFSRSGDGRAVLGPMLREYIISEAIHSLKIPTTRSLAVVKTGEKIVRENLLPGAILTRVASSHIRVGTFQYIAAKRNIDDLITLVDYTIQRHYPEIKSSKNKALDLLNLVMERQCKLVVNWMRVGFIHGVMNTDNMAISGETIDYGPCAFMDHYDPKTVFSSIDKFGRYSFSNQPPITKWNLARLAECLIPLIDKNEDAAIKIVTETIENFQNIYENKWLNMMRDKLGLLGEDKNDLKLINELLNWMETNQADYTNTFCRLMNINSSNDSKYKDTNFINWFKQWESRVLINNGSIEKSINLMKKNNPIVIPRNHKVEEALEAANNNDLNLTNKLLSIFKQTI